MAKEEFRKGNIDVMTSAIILISGTLLGLFLSFDPASILTLYPIKSFQQISSWGHWASFWKGCAVCHCVPPSLPTLHPDSQVCWTSPFEMRESAFPQPCQSWALCSFKNLCHWSSKNKNLILLIDVSLIAAEVRYIHIWISFFLVELLFHVPYPPCFGEWFL